MNLSTKESVSKELANWQLLSQSDIGDQDYEYYYEFSENPEIEHDDLETLFQKVAEYKLFNQLEKYVYSQFAWMKSKEIQNAWYNDQIPYTSFAVEHLVIYNVKYVDLYIDYLKTCDLDCEVRQKDFINKIYDTHGMTEETLRLAIYRCIYNRGQNGGQNLEYIVEHHDFVKWLTSNNKLDSYIAELMNYYQIRGYDLDSAVSDLKSDLWDLYAKDTSDIDSVVDKMTQKLSCLYNKSNI